MQVIAQNSSTTLLLLWTKFILVFFAGSHYQYGSEDRGSEFLCVVSREYPPSSTSNENSNGHEGPLRTDKAKVRIARAENGTFSVQISAKFSALKLRDDFFYKLPAIVVSNSLHLTCVIFGDYLRLAEGR